MPTATRCSIVAISEMTMFGLIAQIVRRTSGAARRGSRSAVRRTNVSAPHEMWTPSICASGASIIGIGAVRRDLSGTSFVTPTMVKTSGPPTDVTGAPRGFVPAANCRATAWLRIASSSVPSRSSSRTSRPRTIGIRIVGR
jgi:hypothetical protein